MYDSIAAVLLADRGQVAHTKGEGTGVLFKSTSAPAEVKFFWTACATDGGFGRRRGSVLALSEHEKVVEQLKSHRRCQLTVEIAAHNAPRRLSSRALRERDQLAVSRERASERSTFSRRNRRLYSDAKTDQHESLQSYA